MYIRRWENLKKKISLKREGRGGGRKGKREERMKRGRKGRLRKKKIQGRLV